MATSDTLAWEPIVARKPKPKTFKLTLPSEDAKHVKLLALKWQIRIDGKAHTVVMWPDDEAKMEEVKKA